MKKLAYQGFRVVKHGVSGRRRKEAVRRLSKQYRWKCSYCGRDLYPQTATVDHVVPLSKGGTNDYENLRLSCARCNRDKGSSEPEQFDEHVKRHRIEAERRKRYA